MSIVPTQRTSKTHTWIKNSQISNHESGKIKSFLKNFNPERRNCSGRLKCKLLQSNNMSGSLVTHRPIHIVARRLKFSLAQYKHHLESDDVKLPRVLGSSRALFAISQPNKATLFLCLKKELLVQTVSLESRNNVHWVFQILLIMWKVLFPRKRHFFNS